MSKIQCSCGGFVEFYRHDKVDRQFRWEAACDGCNECDPNGYATKREAIEGAKRYFEAGM